ncbi:MAG: transposase [Gaiella sp.]|nr:transposase [Gaiella sp.]
MKTADGAFHQCYNGQAVVDATAQVIVAAELSAEAPDARQLEPALAQLAGNLKAIGAELPAGATLSADAGYFSEDNIRITVEHGLDPHIATGRFKHTEPQPPAPRGPIPRTATPKQRMARKLQTKKGRAVYARRKAIIEPVFGQIETVQNGRKLLLRGKAAAREQWRFTCAVHNLLKLHRAGGLALITEANAAPRSAPAAPRPSLATVAAAIHAFAAPFHRPAADRFVWSYMPAVSDPRS